MAAFALAGLSAALYVLGYPGFGLWPLSAVALVPVLFAVERFVARGGQAFAVGLAFGAATQLGGASWLLPTLREFSGLPLAACAAVFALLCVYQGLQLALFVWLCFRVKRAGRSVVLLSPLCLAASELAVPMLFPSPFGASLGAAPVLSQLAELGGPALLTVALAAFNAGLFVAARAAIGARALPWRPLLGTAAGVVAVALYGAVRIAQLDARVAEAPALVVGIVQANLGSWQKRDDRAEGRRRHVEQSKQLEREARPDLIVWPETALHYPVPTQAKTLAPWLPPLATPVLLGALGHRTVDGRAELYNSAYLIDAGGRVLGRSDKRVLLPFAERMPFGDVFPALYELSLATGQFTPAAAPRALSFREHRIAALICYEDVLAGYVRQVVRATEPHLLVDISNDGWFGRSREPAIHLGLARLRAIEHRRFLVRAGNTGVSAVIDPVGRVVKQAAPFARANLVAEVRWLENHTPFARIGDAVSWLALAVVAWAAFARTRRVER